MPIPILRLPYLALKNAMACGEDVEILAISQCSRRAERAVKVCKRSPSIFKVYSSKMVIFNDLERFRLLLSETESASELKKKIDCNSSYLKIVVSDILALSFNVGSCVEFKLSLDCLNKIDQYKGYTTYLSVDGLFVPFLYSDSQLYAFWNEKVEGLQFLVKYFETNFRLNYCSWEFKDSMPELKPLACYLNSLPKDSEMSFLDDGVRVRTVFVEKDAKIFHADYKYLLETVTHELRAEMTVSEDFEFTGILASKDLTLYSAHFFKLEHLLECKCGKIRVKGCKLTNEQLRVFIEKWSTGELSHLEYVNVGLKEELNFDVLLKDTNLIVTPVRFIGRNQWANAPQWRPRDVQRESGERARLHRDVYKFCLAKLD